MKLFLLYTVVDLRIKYKFIYPYYLGFTSYEFNIKDSIKYLYS